MGHLTIFSNTQKKQVIKTSDAFEYFITESKKGISKRRKTKDEIFTTCKEIGNDIMGSNYVGHSFASGLD